MLGLNDPVTQADLLSVFASDLPQMLDAIAQALGAGDRIALARAAHAAKGAAGSAAAQRLWELLASLEKDAATCAFEELGARFSQIQAESARAQAQVAHLSSSSGSPR